MSVVPKECCSLLEAVYGNNLCATHVAADNHQRTVVLTDEYRSAECCCARTALQMDGTTGIVGLLRVNRAVGSGTGEVLHIRSLVVDDVKSLTTSDAVRCTGIGRYTGAASAGQCSV